ncbi:MAG: PaaI family thioesterase [Desulfovibrio sp.]|nr:PaaI family thioesterase [Desulfovibrio sp.]
MSVADNYVAKHDRLVRYLGITIEEASPGYARASMPLTPDHLNGMAVAHGGAIFALADAVFGAAANADRSCGVVNIVSSIEYLLPGKTGPLLAEANLTRAGNRIVSYTVRVYDGEKNLVAQCMTTGYATNVPLPE